MIKKRFYQLILKTLCITFLISFILSSCSREKEYLITDTSDFRYTWKPDDINAISDGPYKGYIKQPYINPIVEIQQYARVLSFYKALCIYIEKIDSSYLSNYYRFEYLNDFYSDGIAAKIKG